MVINGKVLAEWETRRLSIVGLDPGYARVYKISQRWACNRMECEPLQNIMVTLQFQFHNSMGSDSILELFNFCNVFFRINLASYLFDDFGNVIYLLYKKLNISPIKICSNLITGLFDPIHYFSTAF